MKKVVPIALAVVLLSVLGACTETADCDENIKCGAGELCFRSFCKETCTLDANDPEDGQGTCKSGQICRTCTGDNCLGGDGLVCVWPKVCEPRCKFGEECRDAACENAKQNFQ